MAAVTVVRRVPPPIIGVIGQLRDPSFDAFEATLDWLETTGTPVERIDAAAAEALVRLPAARALAIDTGRKERDAHASPVA